MGSFLPDTSLTSLVTGNKIYTYAQTQSGSLLELEGNLERIDAPVDTYSYDRSTRVVRRYQNDRITNNAPKFFTPLAAADFTPMKSAQKDTRCLFYVDDSNILRSMVSERGTNWKEGSLSQLTVNVAHYSSLAATTVSNDLYNVICISYQLPDKSAAIKMVSYSGRDQRWVRTTPDLRDPPLYGTSLTAVLPRPGILVAPAGTPEARLPVLSTLIFITNTTTEPAEIPGFEVDRRPLVFSPHTSLTAVDDGTRLYCIFKSNGGDIKMIEIVNGRPNVPEKFDQINPTPRSAIAACLSPSKTQIILFYQSLNKETMKIDLWGLTLYKKTATSADWIHAEARKLEDCMPSRHIYFINYIS
ncbi:hypothetical protein B9Z19DRAFT_1009408 [Tuber borchii]|uniref:Uncharacterized protein n=1 Tax=Tuber borchii TaxID=42251 RepID=A0A2T6ZAK9_TUBBO|nr:hypothetical protein B9Z19DRAFT_1009408 [Tuber borchii]